VILLDKELNILWVEDDANIIYSLVRPLERDGHKIIIAENEKETLQKLETDNFDLIIFDIIIPTGEEGNFKYIDYVGLKLLEKILIDMKINTPIIIVSVVNKPNIIQQTKDLGVKKFLIKGSLLPSQLKIEIYQLLGLIDKKE